MISDHAHHQNLTKRKTYEGLGYKFSLGHDGWALLHEADQIAHGYTTRGIKGEQAVREGLDHAIVAALHHQKKQVKITPEPAPPAKPAPVSTISAPTSASTASKAHKKAVATAIQFLELAGAQFCIQFDGQTFGKLNVAQPDQPREVRTNYRQFYKPLLDPFKGKGAFSTTINVPPDMDFDGCVTAVKQYLVNHYGRGNAVVEAVAHARKIEILVASVKEEE